MSARLPVLYVDNSSTFGGAINSLAHLVAELGKDDVEAVVVSGQPESVLRDLFPLAKTHSWPMPVPWVYGPRARWLARLPAPVQRTASRFRGVYWIVRHHLPDAVRLARLGRRQRVKIVHLNNTSESQLSGLLAARLLDVPCVAHARGWQTVTWAARKYASMATVHVAISDVIVDDLRSLGVPEERIVRIPDGIDVEAFGPGEPRPGLRAELGISDGAPVFALFGRIVPWKGVREFVEAAAKVIEALPEACALVVGGPSDGDRRYGESVRERARELGLEGRILFTGFRTDVADLMRLCDVVVHASLVPEPFGLVVVEALSTQTPVVAARSGGPTEIVDPGETGFLVDPRDSGEMAEAILRLLGNPGEARRMGQVGGDRMLERFSARRYADDIRGLYSRVLGQHRA